MTDRFGVPEAVLVNVRRRWPAVADGWVGRVDAEFRTLCERYQATPRTVLPARYGFVVAVDTAYGPLVFRSSPDPRGRAQAAVAVALAKLGAAPLVHEADTTDNGTWTVLDCVVPGIPLSRADPATVDPQALFAPLAAMRNQPPPLPDMLSIVDWLRHRLESDSLWDLRPGTAVASASERGRALRHLDELTRDFVPGLCHGDASSGNIIAHGSSGWMYIDPRGMAGEWAYDAAVLAIRINQAHSSEAFLGDIARTLDVAVDRLKAWMTVADAARV